MSRQVSDRQQLKARAADPSQIHHPEPVKQDVQPLHFEYIGLNSNVDILPVRKETGLENDLGGRDGLSRDSITPFHDRIQELEYAEGQVTSTLVG